MEVEVVLTLYDIISPLNLRQWMRLRSNIDQLIKEPFEDIHHRNHHRIHIPYFMHDLS